jgi:hypothetical protein
MSGKGSRKRVEPRLRLRRQQFLPEGVENPEVSVEHGYLWIGGDKGPCSVVISGKKTLLTIAAMLRKYAK